MIVLVAVASCTEPNDQSPLFEVKGQVFFEGKPAAGAVVIFHTTGTGERNASRPRAVTDASGNFTLATYESGDGAPAGEYVVTVQWKRIDDHPEQGTDLLPPAYSDPTTSKLRATVVAGSKNTAVFRLTRKP